MPQIPYIDKALLKERLQMAGLPDTLDPDLDRLRRTASEMVKDRTLPFDETAPPDPVQQVTLMLAVRLRTSEIRNYTDGEGRPVQVPLWTQDLTDILGSWVRDTTPAPAQSPVAGTLRTARRQGAHSEYRRPRYVILDGEEVCW